MEYALISPTGEFIRTAVLDEEPGPVAPNKNRYVPLVDVPVTPQAGEIDLGLKFVVNGDVVERTRDVRVMNDDEIATARVAKLAEIKATAQGLINEVMNDYQQRNALAEMMVLTKTSAEFLALKAKWDEIRDIRAKSNANEAALPTTAVGVATFTADWS